MIKNYIFLVLLFPTIFFAQEEFSEVIYIEHNSKLNIPFTHKNYVDYEYALHKAAGTHSASKPYTFSANK